MITLPQCMYFIFVGLSYFSWYKLWLEIPILFKFLKNTRFNSGKFLKCLFLILGNQFGSVIEKRQKSIFMCLFSFSRANSLDVQSKAAN